MREKTNITARNVNNTGSTDGGDGSWDNLSVNPSRATLAAQGMFRLSLLLIRSHGLELGVHGKREIAALVATPKSIVVHPVIANERQLRYVK